MTVTTAVIDNLNNIEPIVRPLIGIGIGFMLGFWVGWECKVMRDA